MILDADMSQLEWRTAAELSRDMVMINEIKNGMDAHAYACTEWMKFKLTKENRTIAKIFNFRMIYGGSPYSFFMDPKMPGFSLKRWDKIVESFYDKYHVLHDKQEQWVRDVYATGQVVLPSGRLLRPAKKFKKGVWDYSRPTVVNYPVQAYATADLMPLAMAVIDQRLEEIGAYKAGNLFINQVHDSLVFDTINALWAEWIGHVCVYTFRQIPKIVVETVRWQKDFLTPLDGEIDAGESWGSMKALDINQDLLGRLAVKFPVDNIQL